MSQRHRRSGCDNFAEANLEGADLSDAVLTGIDFRAAVTVDARLAGVLRGATLLAADLSDLAIGTAVSKTNLAETRLRHADLRDTGVKADQLAAADIGGALLSPALLTPPAA